jgi:hypothetical protein
MHLYFVTRGSPKLTRRFIEDLQDIYFNFKNKITGKKIGAVQLMPREVKTFECVFPETSKKEIKKRIKEVAAKHEWVAVHFGPFKKDKFIDGVERL